MGTIHIMAFTEKVSHEWLILMWKVLCVLSYFLPFLPSIAIHCTGWWFVVFCNEIVSDCMLFFTVTCGYCCHPCKVKEVKRRKQRPQERQQRIRSESAPAVLCSPRHRKHKQWAKDAMLAVLVAVKSECSIKWAAVEHGVPRTTLYDRHMRRVVHGTNSWSTAVFE